MHAGISVYDRGQSRSIWYVLLTTITTPLLHNERKHILTNIITKYSCVSNAQAIKWGSIKLSLWEYCFTIYQRQIKVVEESFYKVFVGNLLLSSIVTRGRIHTMLYGFLHSPTPPPQSSGYIDFPNVIPASQRVRINEVVLYLVEWLLHHFDLTLIYRKTIFPQRQFDWTSFYSLCIGHTAIFCNNIS